METFELVLLLLAAVLVSSVIDQVVPKITSPLIQIALGLLIALYADDFIDIELDPELFLVLFIAPLLYADAREADKHSLWKNRGPVLALAIGLVFATALIVGLFVHTLIPAIPITAAIALGAALGPTDAVAVSSLPKTLDIGQRERSILKGECLINDASGIVAFQFAAAACATGAFSLLNATGAFLVSFFGGIFIGAALGTLAHFIAASVRKTGLESTTFHVLFDLFTPFIVFLASEPFGASGVIAVVTAGLVTTLGKRRIDPAVSRLNIVSSSVWRVLSYTLNGIVFVLLGTQLPKAMQSTWDSYVIDNGSLILFVLSIALAVELVRFLWLAALEFIDLRRTERTARFGKECLHSAALMTFAGAKGTVTLSIVFTLPLLTSYGMPFPQRQLIIFLASGVILITLLLANFAIPLLARKPTGQEDLAAKKEAEREATIDILRGVIEELAARQTKETHQATAIVVNSYNDRIARLKTGETDSQESKELVELRARAIHWQQDYTQQAIEEGKIDPYIGYEHIFRLSERENYLRNGRLSPSMHARINRTLSYWKKQRHRIAQGLWFMDASEQTQAEIQVSQDAAKYANQKLRELLQDSGDIPTELVSTVLMESNMNIRSMKAHRPSISAMTAAKNAADEVQRLGFALELEGIQNMYEEGRISRACAKRLRENVALMQIDLEEKV